MDGADNSLSDLLAPAEVQRKLDQEAQLTEQALSSVSAGRSISEEAVDAWIDSLDTKHERPPPRFDR